MEENELITIVASGRDTNRKMMIMSELMGKTSSEIYRDAVDAYFHDFVTRDIIANIAKFEYELHKYGVNLPDGVYLLIEGQRLSEAASMIAEAVKKIPRLQAAQPLISKGNRIVGILSI
jgi:hypothetical protein